MPVFLQALAIQFFRGIGADTQELGPFKEFNFFVGANNSGKSTVLDLIHRHISDGPNELKLETLDAYRGAKTGPFYFAVGVKEENFRNAAIERFRALTVSRFGNNPPPQYVHFITLTSKALAPKGAVWMKLRNGKAAPDQTITTDLIESIKYAIGLGDWHNLWGVMTSSSGGALEQHWIPQVLTQFFDAQKIELPKVRFIPTNRQIGRASETFDDFSGRGLIDRLAELQSPDHDMRHELELFAKINTFLQTVTGRADARIEIPHNRQHVLVHMDDKVLPLFNLGTGIHEVVMIAAFCTISERQIVCIEEPESHLHPLLQRKLIAYLQTKTSNQYFVATHSASFIDTPDAAIFHVTNDGVQTRIKESLLRSERFAICSDLGVRASDIVQSNFVVWVEGPSDRLYLKRWIKSVNPKLKEAIHYSIMFYGGRLLSHLSADDDEITEFIKLRSLNQNLCVLMDSDKSNAHARINDTKKRIFDEISTGGGMAWITRGREVENYVEFDNLQQAIKSLYPSKYHSAGPEGAYDHSFYYYPIAPSGKRASRPDTSADKVKIAHLLTQSELGLDVLDLKKQIASLADRIEKAND